MKKFAGHKTLEQIRKQCEECGVELNTYQHDHGDDHVALYSPDVKILYSTVSGRFFGTTPEGIKFSSDDKLDGTPWFDALLDFFLVEKT